MPRHRALAVVPYSCPLHPGALFACMTCLGRRAAVVDPRPRRPPPRAETGRRPRRQSGNAASRKVDGALGPRPPLQRGIPRPVAGRLKAFFVPARSGYRRGYSENRSVSCFIGFSYHGLRAWEVADA